VVGQKVWVKVKWKHKGTITTREFFLKIKLKHGNTLK